MINQNYKEDDVLKNTKTRSLKELFEDQLTSLPFSNNYYQTADEVFLKDDTAVAFINHMLYGDAEVYLPKNFSPVSKGRARHSVISFLFGLCISEFHGLLGQCSEIYDCTDPAYLLIHEKYINYKIWMMTAVNHDYGYYSSYLKKDLPFADLLKRVKYNVLDAGINIDGLSKVRFDKARVLKNNYEQIGAYYEYARQYHKDNGHADELVDHGILGGILMYNRAVKYIIENHCNNTARDNSTSYCNMQPYLDDVVHYKASCLTICQHNIFKSEDSRSDEQYGEQLNHLWHKGGYFIDKRHPLLLFLSLIDTIEHTKRFSTKKTWLQINTLLEKVKLSVDKSLLIIDYSELYAYLDKNLMQKHIKVLNDHINGVCNLETWTRFKANRINDYSVAITYDESNLTIDCN